MTIEPRIGTDAGDTCNRLGCDGVMKGWDLFDMHSPETPKCGVCGYGPENETEEPANDD